MTIIQTVEVPANRRVHFDFEVPREVPEGKTSVIMQFPDRKEAQESKPALKDGKLKLTKKLKEELLADETLLSLTGILHTDMTVDEIRNERLAKYSE